MISCGVNKKTPFFIAVDKGAQTVKSVLCEVLAEASGEKIGFDSTEEIWFEITEGDLDNEKPVITSLTVDKNAETVTAGEKVHVELAATDNVALDTTYASVTFESAVSLDMGKGLKFVELTYDENKQVFAGDFSVDEETYPCEWYCSDIHVYDEAGNRASRQEFDSNFDMTFPYYFYVADDNGTASVVYKQVNIYAETVDEQGNVSSGRVGTYENVERRTTLKELGFVFPETAQSYDGKVFTGWEIDNIYEPAVISKEALEAARGRDIDVVLDMGEYSWVINGTQISDDALSDIDLCVIRRAQVIPEDVVEALAGENEAEQIRLVHNGDFGFTAELVLSVGSGHAGETGVLYYYNNGETTAIDSETVQENGDLRLTFTHASDYILVLEDKEDACGIRSGSSGNNLLQKKKCLTYQKKCANLY